MTREEFDNKISKSYSGSEAHSICDEYIVHLEAELTAHKAKIDGLKEWVKQQEGGKIAYWSDVLQKLEALDK